MKTLDEKEEIVYIEYHDGIPHEVISICKDGFRTFFDIMVMEGDRKHIGWKEIGGGGLIQDTEYPKYQDVYKGASVWGKKGIELKGTLENCKKLEKPLRIKSCNSTSINPFKVATKLDFYSYCDVCEQNHHDYCDEHQHYLESDESPDGECGVFYLDGRRSE